MLELPAIPETSGNAEQYFYTELQQTIADLWATVAETNSIIEAAFSRLQEMLRSSQPLVIVSHDDADGWTAAALVRVVRTTLHPAAAGLESSDAHIVLATGTDSASCTETFRQANIPNNANILIVDLNQDIPVRALNTLGFENNVIARIDHHQIGTDELSAKVVPQPPEGVALLDSSSLLAAVLAQKSSIVGLQSRICTNLALLGLIGDKRYANENRLGQAFRQFPGKLQQFESIAMVLNTMAVRPANLDESTYQEAKARVWELLQNLDVVTPAVVAQFGEIAYPMEVNAALKTIADTCSSLLEQVLASNNSARAEEVGTSSKPGISVEILDVDGKNVAQIVVDEREQSQGVYDMVEPLWKEIFGRFKQKSEVDFLIFAVVEHSDKQTSPDAVRVNYRVGVLKEHSVDARQVAIVTASGGGHEQRAGDAVFLNMPGQLPSDAEQIFSDPAQVVAFLCERLGAEMHQNSVS